MFHSDCDHRRLLQPQTFRPGASPAQRKVDEEGAASVTPAGQRLGALELNNGTNLGL